MFRRVTKKYEITAGTDQMGILVSPEHVKPSLMAQIAPYEAITLAIGTFYQRVMAG